MIDLHPTTRALYERIPTKQPITPARLWHLLPDAPEDSFPRLVVDLAWLARVGALKRHYPAGGKAFYTRCYPSLETALAKLVIQRLESGLLPPNTATKAAADDYERRLRSRYPVVREVDGVWVRVDGLKREVA